MNQIYKNNNKPSLSKKHLTPFLLILLLLSNFLVISSCQRKDFVPKIVQTSIKSISIEDPIIYVDFLINIENPNSGNIEIDLNELKVYKDYETLITEIEKSLSYTLTPGINTLTVSFNFHKNTVIENALDLLFTSTIEVNVVGNLDYKYKIVKGKVNFNETSVIDIRKILNSFIHSNGVSK